MKQVKNLENYLKSILTTLLTNLHAIESALWKRRSRRRNSNVWEVQNRLKIKTRSRCETLANSLEVITWIHIRVKRMSKLEEQVNLKTHRAKMRNLLGKWLVYWNIISTWLTVRRSMQLCKLRKLVSLTDELLSQLLKTRMNKDLKPTVSTLPTLTPTPAVTSPVKIWTPMHMHLKNRNRTSDHRYLKAPNVSIEIPKF